MKRSDLERNLDRILVDRMGFIKGIIPDKNEDPDFWQDLICRYMFKFNQFLFRIDFRDSNRNLEINCRTIPDRFNKAYKWNCGFNVYDFYDYRDGNKYLNVERLDREITGFIERFIVNYYKIYLFKEDDVWGGMVVVERP